MKKFSSKQALLLSVLSMVLCVSMLIGSTFAWFTDSATANVNTIQSGNLDVELVGEDGEPLEGALKWKAQDNRETILWEPGCEYKTQGFRIKNNGNLALKYTIALNGVVGDAKLLEVINFSVVDANGTEIALNTFEGKLENANQTSDVLYLKGKMSEAADNNYMKQELSGITIVVYATQLNHEYDSNGKDYDEGAANPSFVGTADELKAAIAEGKSVRLTSNIALESPLNISHDLTVYGDGYSVISGYPVSVSADANVTLKDVNFASPVNANNNASNLYASGLKGKLVIDGCKFSGSQWDCIQVTPVEGAEIVINGCRFEATREMQRFIHIQAADFSNSNVKVTLTNNFFGATENLKNSMIDLDYINKDGIDFGGNNVYTDIADIYVCGSSTDRTIESADAYKKLGSMLLSPGDGETVTEISGNVKIAEGSSASVDSNTTISAGSTIAGAGKDKSTINANKVSVGKDNVTIKDVTIKGSGSTGTGGTLNINGANTTIENVDYIGDGNIAVAVSTGASNSGTVFKGTKITNAFRGIQFWSLSGDSVIDDCVLDVAGYTFNIDAAVSGSTLTIKNSTLNGWTSYTSGISLVSFENCKLGLNAYQYLRPYSETVIKDCEFTSAGYQLNAGGSDAYTITITNCTKNGTKITAENVKSLLLDTDDWNTNATLIVDGTTVTLN